MKLLQVHNATMFPGGGEEFFRVLVKLLEDRGHQVILLTRSNENLRGNFRGKLGAFFSGIYSLSAHRLMAHLIKDKRPDIVHVHGLNPLLSPSVLVAVRRAGLPLVMHVHAYTLTCPIGLHVRKGAVCDLCTGGREYWCVLKNCRGSLPESIGYGVRNAVARKWRLFRDNVTLYVPPSEFVKRRLVDGGFPEERIVVIPNIVAIPDTAVDPAKGEYVAYVGRMSPEKGINILLAAAREAGLPVRLAGDGPIKLQLAKKAPENTTFVGWLNRGQLHEFYRHARFTVVPSIWFEPFGLAATEPMSHGLPVIVSRIGGLQEIVEDGVAGFLFEPGNAEDLAAKMKRLWDNPDLCRQMGRAGREKAIREYSEDVYYERIMAVYEKAIALNNLQSLKQTKG